MKIRRKKIFLKDLLLRSKFRQIINVRMVFNTGKRVISGAVYLLDKICITNLQAIVMV